MTISAYSVPGIMMGSVSLYVGIYHFLIYSRRLGQKYHLCFSCMCLSLAMFDFFAAGLYGSTSIVQGIPWMKAQLASVAFVIPPVVFFTGQFLDIDVNRTGYAVCGLSVLYLAALFFTDWGIIESRPAVKYIAFLDHRYYEVAMGPATDIYYVFNMGLFGYLFSVYVRHYRQGKKYVLPILAAIGIFFVFGINDMLISMEAYTSLYLAEYSFIALIIGMSSSIVNRFAALQRDIKNLNITLETKVRDRTQRLEKAVAELERSNREFQDFAHIASHDLQEPLRKVTAFGDRLADRAGAVLDDRAKDYLARMQDAAQRMNGLLNGLLGYARVTTKGSPFKTVDMDKVASNVLNDLEVRINETGGRVDAKPLGTVPGDQLQMRQLVRNLVGNALKYHKPDVPPAVKMAARVTDDGAWYELNVADNGIGIADEDKEKAFGIFQRLVGKGEYEGTGVGLAICKKIAERHGGAITLQGEPGTGTTFTVRLPLKRTDSGSTAAAAA